MVEPYVLPIHFDNFQGKHEINSDSLVTFVEAYKEIAEIFGVSTDIQIGVPEEGGWKANLLLGVTFIGFSPFVALLTGETADDWAKRGHIYAIQKINEFITKQANDVSDGLPKECIKQKNKMFQQFQKDDCIDTFHLANFVSIPRSNFYLYIKELPEDEYLYLGETNITVHSPDWKGKRSWTGKIEIIEDTASAFSFDKDLTGKFWEMVKLDTLPLHTTDVMKVQLVKRPTSKVKYLVIRVLSYNNEEIDTLITNDDIRKLATFDTSTKSAKLSSQADLFS